MANRTNIWNRNYNVIKICYICNKQYRIALHRQNISKCCSIICRRKYQKYAISGDKNGRFGEGVIRSCNTCNKEYRISPSRNLKYCSKKCQKLNGKFNPNWKGGISKENNLIRSSNKYKEWRLKRMELDKFTCQICKHIGGNLEVHHIKSQANGGQDTRNNVITLCHNCHKIITSYFRCLGYERALKLT